MVLLPRTLSSPRSFLLLAAGVGIILGLGFGEAVAQVGTVRVEENLRAEPSGTIIARLSPGARVEVEDSQGSWSQVTIEGYVWAQSLQVRTSGSYDLIVAVSGGENLREAPSGTIIGELNASTLLEEIERIPGWIRVRRTAWIWTPSLTVATPAPAPAPAPAGRVGGAPTVAIPPPAAVAAEAVSSSPPMATEGWVRSGNDGTRVLTTPDGEALGRIEPGTDLRIVAREGNWARVQVDGWVWMPNLPVGGGTVGDATILRGVSIRDLTSDFDRYRGRLVEVELQFISLERAEAVRSDFYAGEPFILTRALDEDRAFVYVAVPPGRLAEVQSLAPLERIRIIGRARSGSAVFTGSPILDLMEMTRVR